MNQLTLIFSTLLIFSFSQSAFSRITDNQVQTKITDNKIELTPNEGFHFNAEAPASATFDDLKAIFKPNPKTEKLLVFLAPEETKKAKLNYFVCDDKKTVCEKHEQEMSFATGKAVTSQVESDMATKAVNKFASDKPTLFVFSAPWCPACIRMQTETFNQVNVQNEMKKINVQKINIDLPENVELTDRFHVKAIPTVVLLNKEGDEMNRWLDYQSAQSFAGQLKENLKSTESLSALEKKAANGDAKAISMLGMNAYNSYNCTEAVKWLSQSKSKQDLKYKLAAEVQCASEKSENSEKAVKAYVETLKNAIAKTPSQLDKIRWTVDLVEKQKERKKIKPENLEAAKNALENISTLINDEKESTTQFAESTFGEPGGFQFEELQLMKLRLYAVLDKNKEKSESDEIIKNAVRRRKLTVEKPGEMLLAIAYGREAGDKEYVDKMYNLLIARYPQSYVYHEKYANYLLSEKQLEKSLVESNQALEYPEGNEPKLQLLKAKILKEMNNKEQALAVVNHALKSDKITHKKYKRTLAAIEKLKKELETK